MKMEKSSLIYHWGGGLVKFFIGFWLAFGKEFLNVSKQPIFDLFSKYENVLNNLIFIFPIFEE